MPRPRHRQLDPNFRTDPSASQHGRIARIRMGAVVGAYGQRSVSHPRSIGVRLIGKQVQLVGDFVRFGCGPGFKKCLGHRHFFEEGDRENLEQSVEGGVEGEALLNDGNQDVDGNRDPYLRPNRVVRCAVELFDPQMLLDPFEKQFTCQRLL